MECIVREERLRRNTIFNTFKNTAGVAVGLVNLIGLTIKSDSLLAAGKREKMVVIDQLYIVQENGIRMILAGRSATLQFVGREGREDISRLFVGVPVT